jgi:uncharacterized protein (DUF433 family)
LPLIPLLLDAAPVERPYDKIVSTVNFKGQSMIDYKDIITLEAGKRSGKPCIRGLRITVYDVLSYLAAGMTIEEIISDFPSLTRDDILACLGYTAL